MAEAKQYKYLEPRTTSRFKQLFIKGRKSSAQRVYVETVGEDARTPEEVARDLDLPLEAVLEAIDYCTNNQEVLRKEVDEEWERIREFEKKYPPLLSPDRPAAS